MKLPLALFLALLAFAGVSAAAPEHPVKVVLVGDSTVQTKTGWGDAFIPLLTPGVECINMGKGGRSSKSYRDEGAWALVLKEKPAYILIQFGHNDQPGKERPGRRTRRPLIRKISRASSMRRGRLARDPSSSRRWSGEISSRITNISAVIWSPMPKPCEK